MIMSDAFPKLEICIKMFCSEFWFIITDSIVRVQAFVESLNKWEEFYPSKRNFS